MGHSRQRDQQRHLHDIFGDRASQVQDTVSKIALAYSMFPSHRQFSVLGAITDMDFAASGATDFVPGPAAQLQTFLNTIAHDPICTSSLCHQYFSEVLKALQMKDLQLLRDVDTRWSSTLIMIDRAILLHEVIHSSFYRPKKYKLSNKEWEALEVFKCILAVPHAFQQRLSAAKTPTLGDTLPAFKVMISQWEKQQAQHLETMHIVQQGIDKLESYREWVEDVTAYILSMREFNHLVAAPLLTQFPVINPGIKLSWFERFQPDRVESVKDLFLCEVCPALQSFPNNLITHSHQA
ncbi:hypothetical protein B0H10DRAFT_2302211, partial [Mycena sp. CBHHK59/15]